MKAWLALGVGAAVLAAGAAAAVRAPDPSAPATSFRAVLRYPGGTELLHWQGDRFSSRARTGTPWLGRAVERDGTSVYRYSPSAPTSVLKGTFAATPDGHPMVEQLREAQDYVLGQARAGKLALQPATLRGQPVWHARVFSPRNDCAGFGPGAAELWLRRADLLPVRYLERHDGRVIHDFKLDYEQVNATLSPSAFAFPPSSPRTTREDNGFRRATTTAAAARLSYAPELPAALPDGFRLALTGWAARSGRTGAEAWIAPRPQLFAAVYRRGIEHVDVTERLAGGGGWPDDPFGHECVRQWTESARVGSSSARYGTSLASGPHLYWRSGKLLYTVSGPLPKRDLVAIAESLRPIR